MCFSLYYANVTVGSPGLWFLVALDTGSDLFWLPCDCGNNCIHGLKTNAGVCYFSLCTYSVQFQFMRDSNSNHSCSIFLLFGSCKILSKLPDYYFYLAFWIPNDLSSWSTFWTNGSSPFETHGWLIVYSYVLFVKQVLELNIYSPNTSSTSAAVSCNSTFCEQPRQCSSTRKTCAYQVQYLSNDTSSTGVLVEDILHLISDDSQSKGVEAQVPLG